MIAVPFVAAAGHERVALWIPGLAMGLAGADGYAVKTATVEAGEVVPVPPMPQGVTVKV